MTINKIFKLIQISFILLIFTSLNTCKDNRPKQRVGLSEFKISSDLDKNIGLEIYDLFKIYLTENKNYEVISSDEFRRLFNEVRKNNKDQLHYETNRETMFRNHIENLFSAIIYHFDQKIVLSMKVLNQNLDIIGINNISAKDEDELKYLLKESFRLNKYDRYDSNKSALNADNEKKNLLTGGEVRNFEDIEFVYIPPGKFKMGAQSYEAGCNLDEIPLHRVEITKGFWLGRYEVTQEQWQKIMESNPSHFKHDKNLPVEMISWFDVEEFIKKLNSKSEEGFRLPTEAEWEYACRAGTSTTFWFGDDRKELEQHGWFGKGDGATHPVGQKKPNPWGLYDMYGNVWEWCSDWYDARYYLQSPEKDPRGPSKGTLKAKKSGCWRQYADSCRSASRFPRPPTYKSPYMGFRLAISE
jgi:formylglycine-generating enzyme required for sulfatase activity